jgi:SOS-response transcriptional repressor LexA
MPQPLSLTPLRQHVYDFILKFKQDHDGVSPSVLEIGQACGISSTSITRYTLDCLERLGMIECDYGAGKSRMIKVVGGRWIPPTQDRKGPAPRTRADHVLSIRSSSITE